MKESLNPRQRNNTVTEMILRSVPDSNGLLSESSGEVHRVDIFAGQFGPAKGAPELSPEQFVVRNTGQTGPVLVGGGFGQSAASVSFVARQRPSARKYLRSVSALFSARVQH